MIKSCPFCGGMAKVHNCRDFHNYYTVECCDCGIFVSDNYSREEDAVKDWNNRPAETELLEALKSAWSTLDNLEADDGTLSFSLNQEMVKIKQLIEKYEVKR